MASSIPENIPSTEKQGFTGTGCSLCDAEFPEGVLRHYRGNPDASYCVSCGQKFRDNPSCSACGAKYNDGTDAKFCTCCGAKIRD